MACAKMVGWIESCFGKNYIIYIKIGILLIWLGVVKLNE